MTHAMSCAYYRSMPCNCWMSRMEKREAAPPAETTTPEPEWLTSLRRDMHAEVRDAARVTEVSAPEEVALIADRATGLAASYLHQLRAELNEEKRKVAELEELTKLPASAPVDVEAAVAAMQTEMALACEMGIINVTRAASIAGKHMLRVTESAPPDEATELKRIRGDVEHWTSPVIGRLRWCLAKGETFTPDDMESAIRAIFRARSAFELATYRDQEAVEIPETPRAEAAPTLSVREVPACQCDAVNCPVHADTRGAGAPLREVPASEAREGDTVTITGKFRPDLVSAQNHDVYIETARFNGTVIDAELTVSRPVSPLPTEPGAVIRCHIKGFRRDCVAELWPDGRCWSVTGDVRVRLDGLKGETCFAAHEELERMEEGQ